MKEFGHLRGGLVLVTGPTGSGKSTTLAALIDYINTNFSRHIVTIEEPIEFVHNNKRSIITQREVPEHSSRFPERAQGRVARGLPTSCSSAKCATRNHLARPDRGRDRSARLRHTAHQQRAQNRRPHDRRLSRATSSLRRAQCWPIRSAASSPSSSSRKRTAPGASRSTKS